MSRRLVLIGHPVAHSVSAAMQQAALDAAGIDARYELIDVTVPELPDTIEALRDDVFLGANVTIPHKERVVPMMDRLTEEAQATGAVNTITREGHRLVGHNTDVPGFRIALDELVGRQKMPRGAVVLGAGGGARAVVLGLITAGFQRIVVFNRHLHRAEGMVRFFAKSAAHMELRAMPWHESIIEVELSKAKVLVNASSVGLGTDETPIAGELLPPELLVMDLIYRPRVTRLLADAEAAGAAATMNGELMLLHQGAAAFELWTGQAAPLELMRERMVAALTGAGTGDAGADVTTAGGDESTAKDSEPAATTPDPTVDPASGTPIDAASGNEEPAPA